MASTSVIEKRIEAKKVTNRCPDCGKKVGLAQMFFKCCHCGCSGYLLLDVERWSR